jgi:hypothetical protein
VLALTHLVPGCDYLTSTRVIVDYSLITWWFYFCRIQCTDVPWDNILLHTFTTSKNESRPKIIIAIKLRPSHTYTGQVLMCKTHK